jgi:nucleotide-binding universal stress UspA family protein
MHRRERPQAVAGVGEDDLAGEVAARSLDEEDAAGRSIGEALASYSHSLLVMGAYGHSRMRDFIQGGATKSVIADPPLPVFLSH